MTWEAIASGLRSFVVWSMDVTAVPIILYFILINTSHLVLIGLAYLEFRAQQRRRTTAVALAGRRPRAGGVAARARLQRGGRHRLGGEGPALAALPPARGRRRRRRQHRRHASRGSREAFDLVAGATPAAARDPGPRPGARRLRAPRRPHPASSWSARRTPAAPRRSTWGSTPPASPSSRSSTPTRSSSPTPCCA